MSGQDTARSLTNVSGETDTVSTVLSPWYKYHQTSNSHLRKSSWVAKILSGHWLMHLGKRILCPQIPLLGINTIKLPKVIYISLHESGQEAQATVRPLTNASRKTDTVSTVPSPWYKYHQTSNSHLHKSSWVAKILSDHWPMGPGKQILCPQYQITGSHHQTGLLPHQEC